MRALLVSGVCLALTACVVPSAQIDGQFGVASAAAIETQRIPQTVSTGSAESSLPQARDLLEQQAARRAAPPAAQAPRNEGIASAR